jgi:hypothetical protein
MIWVRKVRGTSPVSNIIRRKQKESSELSHASYWERRSRKSKILSFARDHNGRPKQKLWIEKYSQPIIQFPYIPLSKFKSVGCWNQSLYLKCSFFRPVRCLFETVVRGGRTTRPPPASYATVGIVYVCVDGVCVCVCVCVWCFIDSFHSLVIFSLSAGIPFVRGPLRSFKSVFPTFRKKVRPTAPTVGSTFRSKATKSRTWSIRYVCSCLQIGSPVTQHEGQSKKK